jgi:hypothetical protein
VAVRAFYHEADGGLRFAHTSPVFFDVADAPLRPRKAETGYLVQRIEAELERHQGVLPGMSKPNELRKRGGPAMLRFSLLSLLGAVLVISIGCAALASASENWARIVVTGTVMAILVATVGAFFLPAGSRAFAGGFAICGWAYLLVALGPWLESIKPQLATTLAVNYLQAALEKDDANVQVGVSPVLLSYAPSPSPPGGAPAMAISSNFIYSASAVLPSAAWSFNQIGHSLWAILLAFFGGILARFFDSLNRKQGAGLPASAH